MIKENGILGNEIDLTEEQILENLRKVQEENKIEKSESLDSNDFSIEMETGTGKTYVYLRTIIELNKNYGFKKFIILVPSIAIKEGVIKTLEITKKHFKDIYDNIVLSHYEYDSKRRSKLREFARKNTIEIMIMTIDSINKDTNLIHREDFDDLNGESPISLIAKTNPIVIMDEPQNMESDKAKNSISKLNPLAKLRYSATHREIYNKIYSLTPIDAYNRGLVKKIEVTSVFKENDYNGIYIKLLKIKSDKKGLKAKLEVNKKQSSGLKKSIITVDDKTNLFEKTNNPEYKGISVNRISTRFGEFIELSNGLKLSVGEDNDMDKKEIMRQQIRKTIESHFEKSKQLNPEGIKVLSLFFIDKVDNYFNDEGIIRKIFEEEFDKLKQNYPSHKNLDVKKVHQGYFAKNKKGEFLEQEIAISKNKEAFDLIMKNKEQLLSIKEPVQFIFSHSALKEGWDNPNVFNICTLRNTKSEMRKRQEIGRGVRLPVDQKGNRIIDREFLLTVIANESYVEYVANLQREYEEDGIFNKSIIPEDGNKKRIVKLKKGFEKDENFKELWNKISKKTEYSININLDVFVEECVEEINSIEVKKPKIKIETAGLEYKKKNKKEKVDYYVKESESEEYFSAYNIQNIIEEIKESSGLTRKTIYNLLSKIKILDKIFINPNEFIQKVISIISRKLKIFQIKEIDYLQTKESYSIKEFENLKSYDNKIVDLENKDNCIYEAVVFDSKGEGKLAEQLSKDNRVKLFFKIPRWFIIETPIGTYNPDWAVVFKENKDKKKIYFISETKFVKDEEILRDSEKNKIFCAEKHFEKINANYFVAKDYDELVNMASELKN
jgi:type III restriction enzyme